MKYKQGDMVEIELKYSKNVILPRHYVFVDETKKGKITNQYFNIYDPFADYGDPVRIWLQLQGRKRIKVTGLFFDKTNVFGFSAKPISITIRTNVTTCTTDAKPGPKPKH